MQNKSCIALTWGSGMEGCVCSKEGEKAEPKSHMHLPVMHYMIRLRQFGNDFHVKRLRKRDLEAN